LSGILFLNLHPYPPFSHPLLSESSASTEEPSEPQAERVTPDLCHPKEPEAGNSILAFLP